MSEDMDGWRSPGVIFDAVFAIALGALWGFGYDAPAVAVALFFLSRIMRRP